MALILEIKVSPRSNRSCITIDKAGRIKVYLTSPPEDGKANQELIKLFAKKLGCPQSAVTLVGGATFRVKQLQLDINLSYDEILTKLGLAVQSRLT